MSGRGARQEFRGARPGERRARCEELRAERLHEYVHERWPGLTKWMPSWSMRVRQTARLPSRVVKAQLKGRVWAG